MQVKWAMFGAAKAGASMQATQAAQLGTALVALRLEGPARLPPGCVELVFSAAGQARRAPSSRAGRGETAYAYHPGPYETAFAPFAAAPEIGLRLRYVADATDPRVAQQRFDLFLFSEAGAALAVDALHGAIAGAVRDALAQGGLELPACTTLDEWHAFRAGLNELLYVRFGLTVDDCVPVDLGEACDYADLLRARPAQVGAPVCMPVGTPLAMPGAATLRTDALPAAAHADSGAAGASAAKDAAVPAANAAPAATGAAASAAFQAPAGRDPAVASFRGAAHSGHHMTISPNDAAGADARALRRLFLELPAWSAGLRALALPAGQALFTARRDLLQRCALAALDVNTVPALAWAAPDRPLAPAIQAQRATHSMAAAQVLDQLWGLLAQWRIAAQDSASIASAHAPLLDDADRLTANLAFHLAGRRAIVEEAAPTEQRREPHL
ncbi:hypothetical protein GJ700_12260 [Duganella sp. FT92W]|uniref:Uncharacterized protein n=1 Tax=Pseudoduganella rivuli TaxID=2666085 RepID=A0A7X2LT00_9BURK|nr:hypothetical protein [Pseudoduganella rivuli]MRV72483.1 hypothetical protein [Pseudoduganella rivuli]